MKRPIPHGQRESHLASINPYQKRLFRVVNLKKYYRNRVLGENLVRSAIDHALASVLFRIFRPLLFLNFYLSIFALCNLLNARWVIVLFLVVYAFLFIYEIVFIILGKFVAVKKVAKHLSAIVAKSENSQNVSLADFLNKSINRFSKAFSVEFAADKETLKLISYNQMAHILHSLLLALLAAFFYKNASFILDGWINYNISVHVGYQLVDNVLSGVLGASAIEFDSGYQLDPIDKAILGLLGLFLCIKSVVIANAVVGVQLTESKFIEGGFATVNEYLKLLPREFRARGAIGVLDYGGLDRPVAPVIWYADDVKHLAEVESGIVFNDVVKNKISRNEDEKWKFALPVRLAVRSFNPDINNRYCSQIEDIYFGTQYSIYLLLSEAFQNFDLKSLKLCADGIFGVDADNQEYPLPFEYLWPFSERIGKGVIFYNYVSTLTTDDGGYVAVFEE